jgi:hypothetical protein
VEEVNVKTENRLTHGLRQDEVWPCRFVWMVCFAVLLPVAIVARLSGWRWRPWPAGGRAGYGSPIQEANKLSATIAGTAFSQ